MMQMLKVSSSPHIRSRTSTDKIMMTVIISLMPCLFAGTYFFGFRALAVCLACTLGAVVCELVLCNILSHSGERDLSAVVTGLLLGLS